jgi:hypothetical protein
MLLEQYDRSGMSGVKFAQYVGSTLAYWLQSRRRKREGKELLMKAGADTEPGTSNGAGEIAPAQYFPQVKRSQPY